MANTPIICRSVLDAIGNTPLHEVTKMDTGKCRLFLKLENQNPGGSIKDRIGRSMIEAAEASGALKPGGTIIEATAGNTGLGLALVAGQKGYKLILVVPDKMAQEKVFHLRAMGVDVQITRSDVGKGHPEYYQDVADRLAKENGYLFINQFANDPIRRPMRRPRARKSWPSARRSASSPMRWSAASAPAAPSPACRGSSSVPAPRPKWCWPIPKARS